MQIERQVKILFSTLSVTSAAFLTGSGILLSESESIQVLLIRLSLHQR